VRNIFVTVCQHSVQYYYYNSVLSNGSIGGHHVYTPHTARHIIIITRSEATRRLEKRANRPSRRPHRHGNAACTVVSYSYDIILYYCNNIIAVTLVTRRTSFFFFFEQDGFNFFFFPIAPVSLTIGIE